MCAACKRVPVRLATALALCALGLACSDTPVIAVKSLDNPSGDGARLPNLAHHDGGVVLSWVDTLNAEATTHALRYAQRSAAGEWSDVRSVATGQDWFVNWADFPSLYSGADGSLYAHWLVRSGDSTYAYDVATSTSEDGLNWTSPWVPHLDGTHTEHGFASFFTRGKDTALVWLDGRNTSPTSNKHDDHAGNHSADAPAMSLRTRTLRESIAPSDEPMSTLLDERVCDCCQTAAATTESGAVVFYRDRSDSEVRDIAFVNYHAAENRWSQPERLHEDGWNITGCPVNGPQADARANLIAVAWFTASPGPRVLVAVSTDGGSSFGAPRVVSDVDPIGRVDLVVLNSSTLLVSWLERHDASTADLRLTWYDDRLLPQATATVTQVAQDRRSGFARMAPLSEHSAVMAWTTWSAPKAVEASESSATPQSRVNTALLELTGTR